MAKFLSNREVSALLHEVSAALEIKAADRFRIVAYENAADSIERLTTSAYDLWEHHKLSDILGVGPNLASHLDELFRTGKVRHFDRVKKGLPDGMFGLLGVEGIGAKTAYTLAKHFHLIRRSTAQNQVIKAAQAGRLATLEGFGAKSQAQILEALLKQQKTVPRRMLLAEADARVSQLIDYLNQCPDIKKVSALGSFRRRASTVGDIDIGLATGTTKKAIAWIKAYPQIASYFASGPEVIRVELKDSTQVDFKMVPPESWGALVQHFTGSKAHNVALRELALSQKKSLSEYGIKVKGKLKRFASEKAFYAKLGLAWIPPELREDTGEIHAARKNNLPVLVELKDIQGDLHTHTSYAWISSHDSGESSISQLQEQAAALGYAYVGVGDHNPSSSKYSPSQVVNQVKKRSASIDQINNTSEKRVKNRSVLLLKSLEVDIKPDGTMALPEEAVKYLDYLVASIHSTFRLKTDDMTERVLRALAFPKVKILGHPTGRLLERRDAYQLEWEKVFKVCKVKSIALEVNAAPDRLDLPDSLVKEAINTGVKIAINTDAHAAEHLRFLRYGLDVARRGWATKGDVVNAWPKDKFIKWLYTN